MDKNEVLDHYRTILDEMIDNSDFFASYLQRPQYLPNDILDINGLRDNVSFHTGASRACIVDDDYEWCVKFDIEEDWLGSCCKREVKIYQAATEEGLENSFAEAIYLGDYCRTYDFYDVDKVECFTDLYSGDIEEFYAAFESNRESLGEMCPVEVRLPLYAFRRASVKSYYCGRITDEERQLIKSCHSPLWERNQGIAIEFLRDYGFEQYQQLSKFLTRHKVNDVHINNAGWIDGRIVLIDYAGYHDWGDEENEDEEFSHS